MSRNWRNLSLATGVVAVTASGLLAIAALSVPVLIAGFGIVAGLCFWLAFQPD